MMKCIINTYKGYRVKGYRVHDRYWQPYTLYLLPFTLYLLLLFCSCENRELSADDPCGDAVAVEVVIHWDGINPADKPRLGMAVHLFARNADYINVRNESSLDLLEAYSVPATGLHNTYGPNSSMSRTASGDPEENTVTEPYPYNFFVARNDTLFTALPVPGETQYLHFYPENVLREFTFLVVGVEGTKNVSNAFGAIRACLQLTGCTTVRRAANRPPCCSAATPAG
ncbi:hypothetical protein AGMMS50239_14310 [Bacteroidia bacterium]|nr:hypothetical protein AGMMS50239_14310 [Bacteroidia bacterium]